MYPGFGSPPEDVLQDKRTRRRIAKRLRGRFKSKFQLKLFFTRQRPDAQTATKLTRSRLGVRRPPRVFVHRDQLVLRHTKTKDTAIYTCNYRGLARKVWAVTVLAPGEEPFRVVRWPLVTLRNDETTVPGEKDQTGRQRLLGPKTLRKANIQG